MVPPLIAFFGPDGTGKSTQASLLADHLQQHKDKVKKVWIRSPHTIAFLLSRFFVKIGFYRVVSNPFGRKKKIPAVDTSGSLRFFWTVIELVGVIPVILFRVYIPLFLGYTIIAERYVIDTIVTIAYYTDDLDFVKSPIARFLLYFVPKNTIFIHLDSDVTTIMKRRGRNVESFNFIRFQRIGYKILENSVEALSIDTSNVTVEQTFNQILDWLGIRQISQ